MSKTAIYPGTFDPITFGHIDVIKKALKLFDKIVVAVSDGENKDYLFDAEERLEIVRNALFKDLKMNKKKIILISFKSLTTTLCKKYSVLCFVRYNYRCKTTSWSHSKSKVVKHDGVGYFFIHRRDVHHAISVTTRIDSDFQMIAAYIHDLWKFIFNTHDR